MEKAFVNVSRLIHQISTFQRLRTMHYILRIPPPLFSHARPIDGVKDNEGTFDILFASLPRKAAIAERKQERGRRDGDGGGSRARRAGSECIVLLSRFSLQLTLPVIPYLPYPPSSPPFYPSILTFLLPPSAPCLYLFCTRGKHGAPSYTGVGRRSGGSGADARPLLQSMHKETK